MLIDGDFFESLSDLSFGDPYKGIISPNYNYIIDNTLDIDIPILYIDTGRLSSLLNVVSTINKKFIIISHNSDITYNENIISLIPNNVIRVWCQNYNGFENDKIKLMNLILEKKNKLVNLEGNTVLFVACEQFQIENISLLLENKNIDLGENSIKM